MDKVEAHIGSLRIMPMSMPRCQTEGNRVLTCTYDRAHNCDMYEWDTSKASRNASKHGVCFSDTFAVFEDPNALTVDQLVGDEERHVTMGMDAFGRVLVVV